MKFEILITGGNGFIGGQLINYFSQKGIQVDSLDIGDNNNNVLKNYYSVDITKPRELKIIKYNYNVIIHCAGIASVQQSVKNPMQDFRVNLEGTLNMLELSKKMKCKFIFLSSVSVFDSKNQLPLTENSIKNVSSPYGASKLAGESYCQAYFKTFGTDTRIARIFNVYGPGMKHLFIADMINKINSAKNEVVIGGTGKQIRDYLYIDDVIKAIDLILNKGNPGEDYNICSGEKITLVDLTKILLKKMNREDLIIRCNQKSYPGDIEKWYGDPSKLNSLGFRKQVIIEDGLEKTLN